MVPTHGALKGKQPRRGWWAQKPEQVSWGKAESALVIGRWRVHAPEAFRAIQKADSAEPPEHQLPVVPPRKRCKVRKSWIQTEFTPGQSGASISTQMISSLHMKLAWWAVLGSLIGRNCRFSITGFTGIDGINSLKVHSNLRGFFVHKVEGRRGLPIRLMSQVKLLLTEW